MQTSSIRRLGALFFLRALWAWLLCDAGGQPGCRFATWLPRADVHTALRCQADKQESRSARLIDRAFKKYGQVTAIQVGACDGDPDQTTSNDPLRMFLARPGLHAVLLEPNPVVFKMLQDNLKAQLETTEHILVMNAAVTNKSFDSVPFYVVSPRLIRDFPRFEHFHWARYQLSSMDWAHVAKHHEYLALSRDKFATYIDKIDVRALTPADVLTKAALEPGAVDLLVVDAEGYDVEIVTAFLLLDAFNPKIIIFEATHSQNAQLHDLQSLLALRGYQVARADNSEYQGEGGYDMVAWQPEVTVGESEI